MVAFTNQLLQWEPGQRDEPQDGDGEHKKEAPGDLIKDSPEMQGSYDRGASPTARVSASECRHSCWKLARCCWCYARVAPNDLAWQLEHYDYVQFVGSDATSMPIDDQQDRDGEGPEVLIRIILTECD